MTPLAVAVAVSLFVLTGLLVVLYVRALERFFHQRAATQLMWGLGLAFAAIAMGIEAVVYVGIISTSLLQVYVLLSAALVGVLSLGATRVLRSPTVGRAYAGYIVATSVLLGIFTFLTPLSPGMVTNGIITGDPPLSLMILSSLVTGPATIVLLTASAVSLRRNRKWPTLLMIAGALTLGAGGTLYIASFPVALYYAEFLGIVCLFLGLLSLQRAPAPSIVRSGSAPTAT